MNNNKKSNLKISVAIPDSCLQDESTKLDKSRKISIIARSCAIFKVDTIYVYEDGRNEEDNKLLTTILRYLDTPQFLRKRLFGKINELKFAGVLQPLKIPSHVTPADPKRIKAGSIRDGIVVGGRGKRFVDVGINQLVPYFGKEEIGKRVTIQFKTGYPDFSVKEILREETPEYWGYKVKERSNIGQFVLNWEGSVMLTSRKGEPITRENIQKLTSSNNMLIVFGAPDKGLYEILGPTVKKIQNSKVLNFFPNQGTETVRMEESIIGALSIINAINNT